MNAYVIMRDGYLEGVFVSNEEIKPARLENLQARAEVAGMDIYKASTDDVDEMEEYVGKEAGEIEALEKADAKEARTVKKVKRAKRKDEFGSWAHVDAADHEALFRAARASFEKETARLAASFREHVVVPVCEEHGLSFQSGMKGCSFRKGRMWIGGWEEEGTPEHRIAMKAGLRPIFEILNLDMQEAMGERVFGSLVESVGEGFGTGARVSRAAKRGKADTVKGAR